MIMTWSTEDETTFNSVVYRMELWTMPMSVCKWDHNRRVGLIVIAVPEKGRARWLRRHLQSLYGLGFIAGKEVPCS